MSNTYTGNVDPLPFVFTNQPGQFFPDDREGTMVEIDSLPSGASVDDIFYFNSPTTGKYLSRIIEGTVRAANCGIYSSRLRLNRDVLFSMEGFREVSSFVQSHELQDGATFRVCPLEGLVLLKLLANAEDPSRTKDVSDIDHIIKVYFELNADDVYEKNMDIMNSYDTARANYLLLVGARIIGRKINLLLAGSPASKENLRRILAKRPDETWTAMMDGLTD